MALVLADETAHVVLLSISNSGLICFGDGTPVSQVTIAGVAVIDSNGLVSNQRANSDSFVPVTGSVTVMPGNVVNIDTLAGRVPTVQLETDWPMQEIDWVPSSIPPGGGPTIPAHCDVPSPDYMFTSKKIVNLTTGQFGIRNQDLDRSPGHVCPGPNSPNVNYRWF
jgi:hypothetical protein